MDISRFAFPTQILWPLMLCAAISISQCKVAHKIEPGISKSKTSKPSKPPKPATGAEISARKDIVAYAAKYKGSKYTPTGKRPERTSGQAVVREQTREEILLFFFCTFRSQTNRRQKERQHAEEHAEKNRHSRSMSLATNDVG